MRRKAVGAVRLESTMSPRPSLGHDQTREPTARTEVGHTQVGRPGAGAECRQRHEPFGMGDLGIDRPWAEESELPGLAPSACQRGRAVSPFVGAVTDGVVSRPGR